jgi:hypothetical protein
MLGKKAPAAAAPALEAMAGELNGRGLPYTLGDAVFPPGAWVPVTTGQAAQLRWFAWAEVREKEAADGTV